MSLKELRRNQGKKLKEVANALGLSCQVISNYENLKRKFPVELIRPYANELGVSIDLILDCLRK